MWNNHLRLLRKCNQTKKTMRKTRKIRKIRSRCSSRTPGRPSRALNAISVSKPQRSESLRNYSHSAKTCARPLGGPWNHAQSDTATQQPSPTGPRARINWCRHTSPQSFRKNGKTTTTLIALGSPSLPAVLGFQKARSTSSFGTLKSECAIMTSDVLCSFKQISIPLHLYETI